MNVSPITVIINEKLLYSYCINESVIIAKKYLNRICGTVQYYIFWLWKIKTTFNFSDKKDDDEKEGKDEKKKEKEDKKESKSSSNSTSNGNSSSSSGQSKPLSFPSGPPPTTDSLRLKCREMITNALKLIGG